MRSTLRRAALRNERTPSSIRAMDSIMTQHLDEVIRTSMDRTIDVRIAERQVSDEADAKHDGVVSNSSQVN